MIQLPKSPPQGRVAAKPEQATTRTAICLAATQWLCDPYAAFDRDSSALPARAGLLRFARPELEVPAGGTAQLRMTFDASSAGRGTTDLLVFVDDVAEKRVEECFRVRLSVS